MSLSQHISQEHKISPSAQYISEIVYGGIDGIVTTFAVVAGFAGAGAESAIVQIWATSVILFGLANLFGDGVSMALGKYLSTRSEQDVYMTARKKERHEITHNYQMEYDESVEIFREQGMSADDATQSVEILQRYPELWTKWMMDNELQLADCRDDNALIQGAITLFSFIVFGAIPLIPYLFMEWTMHRQLSLIMTGAALLLLGVVRRYVTRMHILKTIFQVFILGGVAAAVAYYTGELVMKFLG